MGTGGTSVPNGGNREYGVSILKGTRRQEGVSHRCTGMKGAQREMWLKGREPLARDGSTVVSYKHQLH